MMSRSSFNKSAKWCWAVHLKVVPLLLVGFASCGRVRESAFERQDKMAIAPMEVATPMASTSFGKVYLHRSPPLAFLSTGDHYLFSVEFRKDGTAALERSTTDSGLGNFVGHIDPSEYSKLCELLSTSCIESLDDSYRSGRSEGVTFDLLLHDARGMLLKRITEHDQSGPTSFWAVKRAIEGIMSRIEWAPVAEHAFSESR